MTPASKLSTAAQDRTELESLIDDFTAISSRHGNSLSNLDIPKKKPKKKKSRPLSPDT
jgi:hypothetical protein